MEEIPQFGFGTWQESPEVIEKAVSAALQAGYRHIDCAFAYENEEGVGRALHAVLSDPASGITRDDLWVTAKLWNANHAPQDVRAQCLSTLADLRLKHLDLLLVHWPACFAHIPEKGLFPRDDQGKIIWGTTSLFETWRAMEQLVDDGLVRHIGVSNYGVGELRDLLCYSRIKPYMLQIEVHPWYQNRALISYAHANGLRVTAYSPLGGFYGDKASIQHAPEIAAIAGAKGCTPAQLVLAWHMQAHPERYCVIPKSADPARIAENFAAQQVHLTDPEMASIACLDCGRKFCDSAIFWDLPLFAK